jgi:hypothetical protein
MIILFLLLVIAAIALGVLGVVVHGLLYLLFTGVGVLIIAFFLGALWMQHRTVSVRPRAVRRAITGFLPFFAAAMGPRCRPLGTSQCDRCRRTRW